MNERKQFLFELRNLITKMDGLAQTYKKFENEYFEPLEKQIDKVYETTKTNLEKLGIIIKKSEFENWTDFEYSVIQCFVEIANSENDLKLDNLNIFFGMFFYSKCEPKENRYEDLLSTHNYKQLYTEIDSLITRSNNLLRTVFIYYPQFEIDLPILIQNGIITETENGLKWNKSKSSLAKYFDWRKEQTKWPLVERLFNTTGLRNSLTTVKAHYDKSNDFEEIKKILE